MNIRDKFKPKHYLELNEDKKKSILESHMFLKEKRGGEINVRTVAGVKEQKDLIAKEDSSSTNIATGSRILSCILDA